MIDVAGSV